MRRSGHYYLAAIISLISGIFLSYVYISSVSYGPTKLALVVAGVLFLGCCIYFLLATDKVRRTKISLFSAIIADSSILPIAFLFFYSRVIYPAGNAGGLGMLIYASLMPFLP